MDDVGLVRGSCWRSTWPTTGRTTILAEMAESVSELVRCSVRRAL